MFIRPIGSVVNPSLRPAGHPLLRGLLARGAYVWDASQHPVAAPTPHPQDTPGAGTAPGPGTASGPDPRSGAGSGPGPGSGTAPAAGPSARRESAAARPGPPAGRGVPGPVSPGAELTDRLTQLASLAREGLLTPEEFSTAKARLLRD
ncbi:SHOCT domain-containing protein [Streptomyces sp. TBY4]|uniref:SHOCT domain-containing protein n=1 Tax=Streptomyces sp. TBY4 TaxID=2962030 RepID=UPI0020B68349|nr:hypothetical protein [Streptomyces sp. TBY4]MCP3756952.1 hypothetical protein [Streptomyces sp. TBY4]